MDNPFKTSHFPGWIRPVQIVKKQSTKGRGRVGHAPSVDKDGDPAPSDIIITILLRYDRCYMFMDTQTVTPIRGPSGM